MIDVTIPMWVYPILIWMIVWKAVGAWRAARKGHLIWFVAFFIFNTAGVLPIVYLFIFSKMNFSGKVKKVSKKKVSGKKAPTL